MTVRAWFTTLLLLMAACGLARAEPDDSQEFEAWIKTHPVGELEAFLAQDKLSGVVPTRDLLRTATDWQRCGGPRFEMPPRDHWPAVKKVIAMVATLKKLGIVKDVEGASAYRNAQLNACAHGAPRSAHTLSYALDITADPGQVDVGRLCRFWRDQGKQWNMGLSRYPSGRIHLDASGWRTWGEDHTRKTSFCLGH
jgi:hypothetical protein